MRALLAMVCATLAWAQPGTLSVRVVNKVTGNPIPSANVSVSGVSRAPKTHWGQTNSAGQFSLRLEDASTVLLSVTRDGYFTSQLIYTVEIKPEAFEITKTIEMTPMGVVTGRVVDQFGDPLAGAMVRLLRKSNNPLYGELYDGSASAMTDDRGRFRINEVAPGKHYIAAEYSSRDHDRVSPQAYRMAWRMIGGFAVYPGGTDIGAAQQIEIWAGETIHLPNLSLTMEPAVSVEGRLTSAVAGRVSVSATRTGPRLGLSTYATFGGQLNQDGTFAFRDVLPGKFILWAEDRSGPVAEIQIDVGQSNIKGIALTPSATLRYEIAGRVQIDGNESLDFSKLQLYLFDRVAKPDSQGVFQITVARNRGLVAVRSLPGDWYLFKVLVNGQEVRSNDIQLAKGLTQMTLVLNPNGGRVSGRIINRHGVFDLGSSVVLIPETGEFPQLESLPRAVHDAAAIRDRSFTIRGVPPGAYRVAAFDFNTFGVILDPDLLKKHLGSFPLIQVTERARISIDAPVLKLEQDP